MADAERERGAPISSMIFIAITSRYGAAQEAASAFLAPPGLPIFLLELLDVPTPVFDSSISSPAIFELRLFYFCTVSHEKLEGAQAYIAKLDAQLLTEGRRCATSIRQAYHQQSLLAPEQKYPTGSANARAEQAACATSTPYADVRIPARPSPNAIIIYYASPSLEPY